MLVISESQMAMFEAQALRRFEDEMMEHSRLFTPELCQVLGETQLRVAVQQAMQRATRFGFTNRGPMRLYIELMFLFGSDFDSDPMVLHIGRLLREPGQQMEKAERIYHAVLGYRAKVPGDGNSHVHAALERLAAFARRPLEFEADTFVRDMLSLLRQAFPQWVDYTGEGPVIELIDIGRAKALELTFTSLRAQAMIISLMFAFGRGCLSDPLYPWLANTLRRDEAIADATIRAERLERKALIWLDTVIESHRRTSS